jgi:UDPglucose 6-dehydrogenase
MKPDRVVIGTRSERARKILDTLYEPFVRQGNPIIYMDERSAEMTKYAANAYLATRISFMNEIANLCERVGANVDMVRKGIGSDNRIGKRFLFPGIGYGGSCFPKDVQALHKTAQENNYDFRILEAVMKVNSTQKLVLFEKMKSFFDGNLKGKTIGIWGLAFKPNTDDIREAPALYIIEALLQEGASVLAYDPEAMENVRKVFGNKIQLVNDPYDAVKDADALAILTEWAEFRTPDFKKLSISMKQKVIFDGRNVFNLETPAEYGFYYNSIGREIINKP